MPILVSNDSLTELITNAACPRCGYELRGIVDSWTESCPLLGVCSECGLEFKWSEVFCPDKYEPVWCVEFRTAGWLPRSALKTLMMSFRPWRFWRELKMSHEIHWRRICSYLALLALPWMLLYVIEQGAVAARVWYYVNQQVAIYVNQQVAISAQQTASNLAQYRQYVADAESSGNYSEYELQRLRDSFQQALATSRQVPAVNQSLSQAIFEAVFNPLGNFSSGFITYGRGSQPYPGPSELHSYFALSFSPNTGVTSISTIDLEMLIGPLILILPQFIGIPLGFLLLPVSRRRAKVQWHHIGRVTIHSLALPIVIVYPASIMVAAVTFVPSLMRYDLEVCVLINITLWMTLLVWWIFAIRNFLKIPHAWFVTPVLAFLFILVFALFGTLWLAYFAV